MIQLQMLNYVLDKKDVSILLTNNIDGEFFSDYPNEYNFIMAHYNKYKNVPDKTTFLAQFPNFDIIEVKENANYLVDAIFEDNNKRRLAKTFNKIRDCINDGKVEDAMRIYTTESTNLAKARTIHAVDIIRDKTRYDKYVEKSKDFAKYYTKTGFKELDDVIGGWDRHEELVTIMARPNVGKSWILLKVAIASAEQGLTVGLYSGEMSELKVGYRADTLISHISNGAITHGTVAVQNDYKLSLDSLPDKIRGKILVITPDSIGGKLAGVNDLKNFIEQYKLDILCIDQHSLLEDDNKARNPVEKASNISKDLKRLQVTENIPIIAVSQMNRGPKDSDDENDQDIDKELERIAQTDRIGQDSTIVIGLKQKDGVLTMLLSKSRDSEKGLRLKYIVDFDKGIFTYMPTERDALNGSQCEALRSEYEMPLPLPNNDEEPF